MDQVVASFHKFKSLVESNSNLDEAGALLSQLKIRMTEFSFLQPTASDSHSQQNVELSREILEYAVLWSVLRNDIPSFERHLAQVKTYYSSSAGSSTSQWKYTILGLNLLHLLAENRIAEFHTELELVDAEGQSSPFVQHPMHLEQYLMEGSYNKVVSAKANVPSPYYTFFMYRLMDTVREEIASSITEAYETLSYSAARQLLMLDSDHEVRDFAASHNWTSSNDAYTFEQGKDSSAGAVPVIAHELIRRSINYAKELERIV